MAHFTVIFAHGRESGPWGVKIRALARVVEKRGGRVVSRDDTDTQDPDLRVARLIDAAREHDGPVVLVGSSMGGYVAAVASHEVAPAGLFLMAPAFGLPGYAVQEVQPVAGALTVVHGWQDDIVPLPAVLEFAREHDAFLYLVPAAHALIEQVGWLQQVFDAFLERCLAGTTVSRAARVMATF